MDHFTFALKLAFHHKKSGLNDLFPVFVEEFCEHYQVSRSCFVFQCDEANSTRGSRSLTDKDQSRNFYDIARFRFLQAGGRQNAELLKLASHKADRMSFQR